MDGTSISMVRTWVVLGWSFWIVSCCCLSQTSYQVIELLTWVTYVLQTNPIVSKQLISHFKFLF